jgi:hypothetical protein
MQSELIVFTPFLLLASSLAIANEPSVQSPEENKAIRKGLAFVETKGLNWLRVRKCASCHHVPQMVWVQRDARARGFEIDAMGLAEATEFLLAADNRAGIVPNPGDPERAGNPYSLLAAYTVLAFRNGGKEAEPAALEVNKKATSHLLSKQESDGSWKRFEGRSPVMPLQESSTLLAEFSLGPEPKDGDDSVPKRKLVRQWLDANSKGDNAIDLSGRILVAHNSVASVEQLLTIQNEDGGWSQTKEMASDAYATGTAMYALLSRGGVDKNAPSILRARDFLVKAQEPDGSWKMTSRPPNNGNGTTGAGNLEPITVAGSAWAVLGLLQRVPQLP